MARLRASGSPVTDPAPLTVELLGKILPIIGEINAVLDPDQLLPVIARQLRRLVDYQILDIFLPDNDGTLVPAFMEGYAPESALLRVKPGEGIVGSAAQLRQTVFVPDVSQDRRYLAVVPGVVSELAIPLLHRDRLVGVLNVEGSDPRAFTPEARTTLQVLASHLAVAIENATLYRETRWYAGLLATLNEIGKETASILDLDQLLQRLAEVVKRVIDYERFGILLVDEEKGELVLRKAVSFGGNAEKTRIKLSDGLCGAAARTKQPVLVRDVREDPRYLNLVPGTLSELVVPLISKDRVVGVFDLESSELGRFTEEHVEILTPLASQVAAAVENARLYDELVRRDERLNRELDIARRVQHGLFPEDCPAGVGWEASAHFLPAQELGGDLYDFYDLGEGAFAVAVGDVAGKGIPAALYGAFASGIVRARALERTYRPGALLARVNRTLRRRGVEGLFCTLAYAAFDLRARRLTMANSGLPYPLHYRAELERCETLALPGLPLGAFDGSSYEERSVDLRSGDVVVFFTDGVIEASREGEEYGIRRLVEQVERYATLSAAGLGGNLLADLDRFLGSALPADDVTFVVVKIL
jgi:sigma-B regulation protein RsbU (phosphoserine phosphatase)